MMLHLRSPIRFASSAVAVLALAPLAQAEVFVDTFDYASNGEFTDRYDVVASNYTFDATGGKLNVTPGATTTSDAFTAVDQSQAYFLDDSHALTFGFTQEKRSTNFNWGKVWVQDVNDETKNIGIILRHRTNDTEFASVRVFTNASSIGGTELLKQDAGFDGSNGNTTNGTWRLTIPTSGDAIWSFVPGSGSTALAFTQAVALPLGFRDNFTNGVHIGVGQANNGAGTVEAIYDNLTVEGTVVPEPSSVGLALAGLGLIAMRRRRSC